MRKPIALALAALLAAAPCARAAPANQAHWIGAYTFPAFSPADTRQAGFEHDYAGHTIREPIRLNAAGARLRIRFTNETGEADVVLGRARIALAGPDGQPIAGSERELTFAGHAGHTIPRGTAAYSDPVDLPVPAFGDVLVSTFFPGPGPVHLGGHLAGLKAAAGDETGTAHMNGAAKLVGPSFVSRIDVIPPRPRHVLVAVGDSITEGAVSTPGAHMSWPEQFARRLATSPYGRDWSVVNAGISGNRVLHDGSGPKLLARFDRDVLDVPGVSAVVVLEGVNDVGKAARPQGVDEQVTANELIGAYKLLIAHAHARGVRIYGGTILPYEGAQYYSAKGEGIRKAVNAWIRTGAAFDGVIDFDAAARDPAHPARLSRAADSGDHLHPADGGYTILANAVDPALFAKARPRANKRPHTETP